MIFHNLALPSPPTLTTPATWPYSDLKPSTLTVLDLGSGDVLTTKDFGDVVEEIEIGPHGQWVAIVEGAQAEVLDLGGLTIIGTASTYGRRFVEGAQASGEMAFAPDAGTWRFIPSTAKSRLFASFRFRLTTGTAPRAQRPAGR